MWAERGTLVLPSQLFLLPPSGLWLRFNTGDENVMKMKRDEDHHHNHPTNHLPSSSSKCVSMSQEEGGRERERKVPCLLNDDDDTFLQWKKKRESEWLVRLLFFLWFFEGEDEYEYIKYIKMPSSSQFSMEEINEWVNESRERERERERQGVMLERLWKPSNDDEADEREAGVNGFEWMNEGGKEGKWFESRATPFKGREGERSQGKIVKSF